MKKYIISIFMMLIMFLVAGCAADGPYDENISIYGDLTFNFDTLTYTETHDLDILYHTGHPSIDFFIFYDLNQNEDLSAEDLFHYQMFIEDLDELSRLSLKPLKDLLLLSSSDLKTLYETHEKQMGLSDIVIFNNLKQLLNSLETSLEGNHTISKVNYINIRLSRALSEFDIHHLQVLQDYHLSFNNYGMTVYIKDETFESWKDELILIDVTPHESDLIALEDSFELIKELINS